ncbi:unnamed protein product, partial [Brassica oleracea var. botrytis]
GGASARVLVSEGFPSLPCLFSLICFIVVLFTISVLSVALFLESCRRRWFCREFLKLLGGTKARRGGRLAHCSRLSCGPWSLVRDLEVPFNSKSRLASTPACVGVVVFGAGSIVVYGGDVVYGMFVALLGCSSQSLSLFSAVCNQYSSGAMST